MVLQGPKNSTGPWPRGHYTGFYHHPLRLSLKLRVDLRQLP
jgi:hypothetical protein